MKRKTLKRFMLLNSVLLIGWLGLFNQFVASTEDAIRIRNSLIADVGKNATLAWEPSQRPADYLVETAPVPPEFQAIAARLFPETETSGAFAKSLRIAHHMVQKKTSGEAVMGSPYRSYRAITEDGRGYCADFSQVFTALAHASDVEVREWGLAFEGFGGSGHAFNEIYEPAMNKWVMVDAFNSFYVEDTHGIPLSVMEFRDALSQGKKVRIVRIVPERFGFKSDRQLLDYYRKGAEQFYLFQGNNVFSYDNHPVLSALAPVSRSAEQAAGILLGELPGIVILNTGSNQREIAQLFERRNHFLLYVAVLGVLILALLYQAWLLRKLTRQRGEAE